MSGESTTPTPWALRCWYCDGDKLIYLTHEEYMRQMKMPNCKWQCPRCGNYAHWDDENYEERTEQ